MFIHTDTCSSLICVFNTALFSHYSPLAEAARGGHAKICSLLLSAGANVDLQNELGWTAMHEVMHMYMYMYVYMYVYIYTYAYMYTQRTWFTLRMYCCCCCCCVCLLQSIDTPIQYLSRVYMCHARTQLLNH